MSENTITVSRASWQELESRIRKMGLIIGRLDVLVLEARQASKLLDDAYKNTRPEEE